MIRKGRKCIASKCEKCNFYRHYNMVNDKGEKAVKEICAFDTLFNELPKILGGIDGCQEATNKTFNKVIAYGQASVAVLDRMDNHKLIG